MSVWGETAQRAWLKVRNLVAQAPEVALEVQVLDEAVGHVEELNDRLARAERALEQLQREAAKGGAPLMDLRTLADVLTFNGGPRGATGSNTCDLAQLELGLLTPEEHSDMVHAVGCGGFGHGQVELPKRLQDCWRNSFFTGEPGALALWEGLVARGLAAVLAPRSKALPGVTFGVTAAGFEALRGSSGRFQAPSGGEG